MADADIYNLVYGDEPTAQESAQAMAAALRRQQAGASQLQGLGLLSSFGENPTLAKLAPAALHAAGANQEAATTGQHQLGQLLLGKLQERLREQQASAEQAYREGELGVRREQLRQDAFQPFNETSGATVLIDKKHARVIPVSGPPGPGDGGTGGKPLTKEQEEKLWEGFQDRVSKVKGRGNASVEQQKRLYAIERLEGLGKREGGLTPEERRMFATDLASVYAGGGAPTEGATKEIDPHTWRGDLARTLEYLSNNPQDAGADAFIKRQLQNASELKRTINAQILHGQLSFVPNYVKALKGRDPQRFNNILKAADIDPELLDEGGLLKERAGSTPTNSAPTHYLISPDGTQRIPAGPDGQPLPGAKPEPNPHPPKVASRG